MILQQVPSLKKAWVLLIIVSCALAASYLIFVSIVTIWTGIKYIQKPGSWLPIMTGTVSLTCVLWFFFYGARRVMRHMKEKDVINL